MLPQLDVAKISKRNSELLDGISMNIDWYEVWADDGLEVPYLLLLLKQKGQEGVIVIDPKEKCKIVHQSQDYESAKLWLLEDEYTQVDGRM